MPPTFTLEEEDTTFENNNRKKNENKCEECLSFLHNATEKVRSKEFRARLYKVVDEMCQRVFPDDAGEEDDKKIAECEALGKTYAKRAIEYVKKHEEETILPPPRGEISSPRAEPPRTVFPIKNKSAKPPPRSTNQKSTTPCKRGWTTERHARICSAVKSCDFASVQCARERETDV